MTRKHFIAMAKELRMIKDDEAREQAIAAFIEVARSVNSRFDIQRFRAACNG